MQRATRGTRPGTNPSTGRSIDAAVSWVLSHDEVTGLAMVGDVTLVPMMLEAENRRMSREEAEQVLSRAPDYSSPFISIPF